MRATLLLIALFVSAVLCARPTCSASFLNNESGTESVQPCEGYYPVEFANVTISPYPIVRGSQETTISFSYRSRAEYTDLRVAFDIEGAPLPFLRQFVQVDACPLLGSEDNCVLPATSGWEFVTVSGNIPAAAPAFPGDWCGRVTLLSSSEELVCAAFNIVLV